MRRQKNTKKEKTTYNKSTIKVNSALDSSYNSRVVWTFEQIDRSGYFAFDPKRDDFDITEVFDKLLSYSTMTWADVISQTHDDGKSKHHHLDMDKASKEAKERFNFKQLYTSSDNVFSFALQNKLRIIGIKEGQFFRAIWYDPKHEFYPVTK